MKKFTLILFFISIVLSDKLSAAIVYVNGAYSGSTEDGLSWATPYKDILVAINAASPGDQLWVAKGTYLPPDKGSLQGLYVNKNLNLFGGFNGDETSVYSRDLSLNKTILSGNSSGRIFSVKADILISVDGFEFTGFTNAAFTEHYDTLTSQPDVALGQKFYLTLNNCKFSNGGYPVRFGYYCDLTISNSLFDASSSMGVILIDDYLYPGDVTQWCSVKLVNTNISNYNSVPFIVAKRYSLEATNSTFKGNSVYELIIVNGGEAKDFLFDGCTVTNSQSRLTNGSSSTSLRTVTYNNCLFESNNMTGPLILCPDDRNPVVLTNCTFRNNIPSAANPLITIAATGNDTKFVMDGCLFENNSGNLLVSTVGINQISNCKFLNNVFTSYSSSNCSVQITNSNGNASITNIEIDNLTINGISGTNWLLVSKYASVKNLSVKNCSGNTVCRHIVDRLQMENCSFENNNSLGGAPIECHNNTSAIPGGYIKNCSFTNNQGASRGALNITMGANMYNCTFKGNVASSLGGAMAYLGNDHIYINDCLFEGNTSSDGGGAISNWTYVHLNRCKFINNKSLGQNGGGALYAIYGIFYANNCLFDGNSSMNRSGGAVFMTTGSSMGAPTLSEFRNCTFVRNTSVNQSFEPNESEVMGGQPKVLANCIIWNNGTKAPLGSYYPSGIVTYSDIQGGYPGEGNLDLDPKFIDMNGGDYHLSCSSPLINKGNNELSLESTDLDNTTRIYAGTVDMGCYEFPQDPATVSTPPAVAFSMTSTACKSEVISYTNSTTPTDGVRFDWDFGDGTYSQLLNPSHSYQSAGTYTVSLRATNACGASSAISHTITVTDSYSPTITYAKVVCPGQTATFNTNSTCPSLQWSVEGGTIVGPNGTTSVTVLWGDGSTGNGKVTLLATGCGTGLCETPVSITIPIVPVNFQLQGPVKLCQGAAATYETVVKDNVPSTVFMWSVKGGTINGNYNGYNLHQVDVRWSSTDTLGVVYLTTYDELLRCGRTDSIRVKLRPKFTISGNQTVCEQETINYNINVGTLSDYNWTVSGSNSVSSPGSILWGTTEGGYELIAQIIDTDKTCNVSDTLIVNVFAKPQILAVSGATEVNPNTNEAYTVTTSSSDVKYTWTPTGGSLGSSYANTATIYWTGSPYHLSVIAKLSNGACTSDPFDLDIVSDFVFTIIGPDTVCIGTSDVFTSNDDPQHPAVFTWSSNFTNAFGAGDSYQVTFDKEGNQSINLKAERNGKEYNVFKNVYVKAASTDIAITGRQEIDPQGTGTYTYTVRNSQNLSFNYTVIGAANTVRNGNDLTVTWGGNPPFSITVVGIVPGNTCTGVPAVLTVTKAAALSTQITSEGSPCVNSRVKYTYVTDNLATNQNWSVSGGGTIISNSGSEIIVEWASTGNYTVNFSYDRFGTQSYSLNVNVKSLPTPVINDTKVCGSNPTLLSTSLSYSSYKWYQEPNTVSFSSAVQPSITQEGQYRVEVIDGNGCAAFASKYIEQTPLPKVKIFSSDDLGYCKQSTGVIIPVKLKTYEGQDYHYQWYANGSPVGTDSPILSSSVNTSILSNVNYTVKVTLESCSQTSAPALLSVYNCGNGGTPCNDASVSFNVSSNNGCPPFTFNNTSANISPNDVFGWTFGDGTSSNQVTGIQKTYSEVGIYNVYLSRGCQITLSKVIVPGLALFKVDAPGCQGQSLNFNELSVNIPDYPIVGWEWDFGDGTTTGRLSGTGSRDHAHTFVNSGGYVVKLTIYTQIAPGQECSNTFQKEIIVTPPPVANFNVSPPPCTDNTYKFIDNSTFQYSTAKYLWNFGNGNSSTLKDPSQKLAPGTQTISLQVTDLLGCSNNVSKSQVVLVPNEVGSITVTGDTIICNGRTVTLTSPLGSTYVWKKDGVVLPDNTQSITVSVAGSYTVDYSVPGCVVSTSAVVLKNYTVPNLLSGNQKVCVGDVLNIQTNLNANKYTFNWQFNGTDISNKSTQLIINNAQLANAGNYTVSVTDVKNGCILSLPDYTINVYNKPTVPTVTASQPQACYNGSVTLNSGVTPTGYSFAWYKGTQVINGDTSTSAVISNITTADNYAVVLTDKNSGCSVTSGKVYISVAPQIQVSISGDQLACEYTNVSFGTSLSILDYSFQWYKDGVAVGPNNNRYSFASVLLSDAGNYNVVVTSKGTNNLLGCQASSNTLPVVIKAGPVKPVITGPTAFCTNSPITLSSNLSSDFLWNTGATTSSIQVSVGGTYTVTSTNPTSGCSISASQSVTQNPLPDLSFFPSGDYERCASDRVSFQGLDAYSNYAWYVNGVLFNTTNKMYPTKTGKYTLKVTTDKGCVGYSDTLRFTSLKCPCYVTNTNDDGVGSLREAIECSNSKYGRDYIDFAIPGTGPFVIVPQTALPVLTDSVVIEGFTQAGLGSYAIIVDGSVFGKNGLVIGSNLMYNDISGLTFRNYENALKVESGVSLSTIDSNVFLNNTKSAIEFSAGVNSNLIADNSISSSATAIVLNNGSNYNQVTRNTITTSEVGIGVYNSSSNNTLSFNELSGNSQYGIWLNTQAFANTIQQNTILSSTFDGIYLNNAKSNTIDSNFIGVRLNGVTGPNAGSGIRLNSAKNNIVKRNLIGMNQQHGIMLLSSTKTQLVGNYVGVNSTGNAVGNGKSGIYSTSDSLFILSNKIANNTEYGIYQKGKLSRVISNAVSNNVLGGIYVDGEPNRISQSVWTNTNTGVKAIDLHASVLPAGNANKQPATFTKYRRSATGGLILKGTSVAADSVEIFINDNNPQQALKYVGVAVADASGIFELEIPVGIAFDPNQKNYYVNTASDGVGNTSELSSSFMVGCFNCICLVTNTNDSGTGSLRGEVDNANTGGCLTINFSITTPDTISILSPISNIVVPLTINGTQGGTDPLIFVKGNGSFNAFDVLSDGVNINNLGLSNFKTALSVDGDYSLFTKMNIVRTTRPINMNGNYNALTASAINTFSSQPTTFNTDTLLVIKGNNNEVGRNGEGNRFIDASKVGVAVSGGLNNRILYNEIYDNTIAIAHVLNGNHLQPVPYNMVGSIISGVASVTGQAQPNDKVQLFMSAYYAEQAYKFAVEVNADGSGNWTAIIPASLIVPNQNNYVVATATDQAGNTSPLSPPVRIGTFVQVCYVTNTLDAGKGSLREAVNCANLAGVGMGVPARIEFQLPSTPNEILVGSGFTITNNFGVKINPYSTPVTIKAQAPSYSGFTWATNYFEIKNLTFDNFGTALNCQGSYAIIDSNEFVNDVLAIGVNAPNTGVLETITHNYFANDGAAILSLKGSLSIQSNTLGAKKDGSSGALTEFGISVSYANSVDVRANTIDGIGVGTNPLTPADYKGIPLYLSNSTGTVYYNTITGTGNNPSIVHLKQFNSSALGSNTFAAGQKGLWVEQSQGTSFDQNQLQQITSTGIDAVSSDVLTFTKNTVVGLQTSGKPIELHLNATDHSNNNKPAPVFISATYHNGLLYLIGSSEALDEIELFYSDVNGLDLVQYIDRASTDSAGVWSFKLPISAANAKNYYFRATARQQSRTSEASDVFNPALSICLVTTSADNTTGSLREAITKANANTCNIIQFDIAPAGLATLEPASDLPVITATELIVDATSQPGYSTGNPTILVQNTSSAPYGFSVKGSNQFDVYGIKMSGYDTSIAITNAKIVELRDNILTNFNKVGVGLNSNVFVYGNILYNTITSTGLTGIRLEGANNIVVDTNSISSISDYGIYSKGVNQKIMGNTIVAGNTTSAIGIAVENGSDGYFYLNTIKNAHRGMSVEGGQMHRLNSNTIGLLDSAALANNYKVAEYGIYMDNTSKTRVYRNLVNGTQKAVVVENSFKPTIQNTKSKQITDAVINVMNCDSAIIEFNSMDSIKTGIYVSNSNKSQILNNNMSNISDYGIYLDTGADSSYVRANNIGAEYIGSAHYSNGEGMHIKSSHNIVGGSYAADSTVANSFFHNKKGGVVVEQGIDNLITYNNFFENDISLGKPTAYAIHLINNGNNNKTQPEITDHKYISGMLHLYGTGSVANDSVHVYIGNGGYEEARGFMGVTKATGTTWEVVIDTTGKVKPQTTLYLVATATDVNKNTSPLSKMYILGDCYVTSLRDTTDNDYPMPNSLRMAVNCANGQKSHVGIYYKVDQYGDKDVVLQMKLQPIHNPYGVSFNAKNLITDGLLGGIDGAKLPVADDTAWVVAESQGPSTFDSLHVDHCNNGLLILADSISMQGLLFEHNKGIAIATGSHADSLVVRGSSFKGPDTLTASVQGIVLASGIKYVTIEQNAFAQLENAVVSVDNDSLVVSGNTFGVVASDTAIVNNNLSIANSKYVLVDQNTFYSTDATSKAIHWDNVQGVMSNNTFDCNKATAAVDVLNSDGWVVTGNSFRDTSVVYLNIDNAQHGVLEGNYFRGASNDAVLVNNSAKVQIKENIVYQVTENAFDVTTSDQVFVSRNIVTNVHYDKTVSPVDSGLCISIHKGLPEAGNHSKPEPINLGYAVKKGADLRTGLFVQGTAEAGDSVELFFSDSLSASMNKYLATGIADANGLWEIKIPRTEYHKDTITWYHVVAVAIRADSNTSQTSSVLHIPPTFSIFYVRNDYDSGANSLRDAMEQVNASDLYSQVIFQIDFPEFQPGPYHIKLDSMIDPIYSYLGYVEDGNTQLGKGAGDDQRIIVESGKIDTAYVFDVVDSSYACEMRNIWFNDARLGVRLANKENKIKNFHFITSGTLSRRDTAFVVTGEKNEVKGLEIHDYKAAVLFTDSAGENKLSESYIDQVGIAVIVSDSAYKNEVNKLLIYNTSETAILADSAAADNVFTNNSIGMDGMPVNGVAITVNNSPGQTFTYNRIPVIQPYTDGRISSAVIVTGNSTNTYFFGNKIGVDSLSETVYSTDARAFSIVPSTDGTPRNTTITGNEMAGMNWVAIYAESSTGDLIGENLIGTDSLRQVHEIDSTAIYFKSCNNMEASDNVIYGYKVYGINLVTSDNIRMNRNVIHSTFTDNKAININAGTPDESNAGLVIPVITNGVLVDTQTVRLSGTSKPGIAVEVYESVKDTTQSTAYVNKVVTQTDANGSWTIDVPRKYFSFAKENCFVAQNHEGTRSSEFSTSYRVLPLLCQLAASNPAIAVLDPKYTPCPGPPFVLDPGLDDGLHYNWTSSTWNSDVNTRTVSMTESVPDLTLNVTDDFGCSLTRNTDVEFKPRPINPDFIVSSEVYAGDTIVLVDISLPVPTEYTWYSSQGVTVLSEGSSSTLIGEDGNTYPAGTRFIEFILPDSGSYNITQKSLRDGCKVVLSKDIAAKPKNPNDNKPYFVAPEIQSLSAYPNPSTGYGITANLTTGTKNPVTLSLVTNDGVLLWTIDLSDETSYKVVLPDIEDSGVYLLKLETASKKIVFKLVVN